MENGCPDSSKCGNQRTAPLLGKLNFWHAKTANYQLKQEGGSGHPKINGKAVAIVFTSTAEGSFPASEPRGVFETDLERRACMSVSDQKV